MDEEVDERATKGRHTGVADFVPASHRRLPLLRLYLPFYDPKLAAGMTICTCAVIACGPGMLREEIGVLA